MTKCFVGQTGNFEIDSMADRKPMEDLKETVRGKGTVLKDDASDRVLNVLKFVNVVGRYFKES